LGWPNPFKKGLNLKFQKGRLRNFLDKGRRFQKRGVDKGGRGTKI